MDVIGKDTDRDNFLSAQQAVDYGLIDKIITSRELEGKDSENDAKSE